MSSGSSACGTLLPSFAIVRWLVIRPTFIGTTGDAMNAKFLKSRRISQYVISFFDPVFLGPLLGRLEELPNRCRSESVSLSDFFLCIQSSWFYGS